MKMHIVSEEKKVQNILFKEDITNRKKKKNGVQVKNGLGILWALAKPVSRKRYIMKNK